MTELKQSRCVPNVFFNSNSKGLTGNIMSLSLYWNVAETNAEINSLLTTLSEEYPVYSSRADGLYLNFEQITADEDKYIIDLKDDTAVIKYSNFKQAARAVGTLLSGLVKSNSTYRESTYFKSLGIMLDCSRNAVMKVDHIKLWMRRLALLGYNTVMLYTEDTYELPDEPYFGYQRGAYSEKELKEIDRYAAKLNIEVVPCIQTLGHLEKILRHPVYDEVKDTSSVMLVGEKKTYELIEKMVLHWKNICRTKRIHIGMDETHDLGRGRYIDKFGYKTGFELFNEHLAEVCKICRKHGLDPMIWSDMYFRLGNVNGDYYEPETVIPKDVVDKIPKEAELVYWDYYHNNKAFYLDWIKRHREMNKEPVMASGIWTWNKYWYDHKKTVDTATPCLEACLESKVNELIFTQWGDNGAYCDHDSAFAGMTFCADKAFGVKNPSEEELDKRFSAICGGSYKTHILASEIHNNTNEFQPDMWDDPFFETHFRSFMKEDFENMQNMAIKFHKLSKDLKPFVTDKTVGNTEYAYCTCRAFADRYVLSTELLKAYRNDDKQKLAEIKNNIPEVQASIKKMADSFRSMWMSHNKPQGIETIQARFGMLTARYDEMIKRIEEYCCSEIDCIPELDCKCPPK